MNIKKKLIALCLICAMSLSAVACNDKDSSGSQKDNIEANANVKVQETFSSEDIEKLKKHELTFTPVDESGVSQDPAESILGTQGGNNSSQDDSQSGNNSQNGNSDNNSTGNSQNGGDSKNESSIPLIDESDVVSTDPIFVPGGDATHEDSTNGGSVSDTPIAGTKETYQVFWMDLTKGDFIFDGEYITATFKIKDDAKNGTYPITIDWMDFANYSCKPLRGLTGIDGAVYVGSEAAPNSFENGGNFEIMAENVSGNPGDEVTVTFKVNNNPGFVACLFRFGYDSDVLEFVKGGMGSDFEELM